MNGVLYQFGAVVNGDNLDTLRQAIAVKVFYFFLHAIQYFNGISALDKQNNALRLHRHVRCNRQCQ